VSSGSSDQRIKTWSLNDGSTLKTWNFYYNIKSFVVLNNGYLAIIFGTTYLSYVSVYDVSNGIEIAQTLYYASIFTSIVLMQNSYLAVGENTGNIYFGNQNDASNIDYFSAHTDAVVSLAVLQNGYLVSSSQGGEIKIWNATFSYHALKQTIKNPTFAWSLAELKNGYLACGLDDGTIRIWNIVNGSEVSTLTGHFGSVNTLAIFGDSYLFSGGADETIKIWNTNGGSLINQLIMFARA
jgi:WD40 repeat protein